MRKLIDKVLIKSNRADNTAIYKIKYVYKGWFKTYEVYDDVEFDDISDANIFYSLSIGPSKKGRYSHRLLTTKYDLDINLYVHKSAIEYKAYKASYNTTTGDPRQYFVIYNPSSESERFKISVDKFAFMPLTFLLKKPGLEYGLSNQCQNVLPLFDDPIKYIETIINIGKQQILKQLKDEADKDRQTKLHNTEISVETLHSSSIDIKASKKEIEEKLQELSTIELDEKRNELINSELQRIEEYKQHLISLLK